VMRIVTVRGRGRTELVRRGPAYSSGIGGMPRHHTLPMSHRRARKQRELAGWA
jgi:hypothetical protein